MSSSDSNITFKKTSFLSGINSEIINQLYSDFLSDPKSLPEGWKKFFEGLSDDEKLILNDNSGIMIIMIVIIIIIVKIVIIIKIVIITII